jgi:hypothetical protein
MTKKLIEELTKMEDWHFNLLEHHIWVARQVRDTMSKNAIDEKAMAIHLGVPLKKIKTVINGLEFAGTKERGILIFSGKSYSFATIPSIT